MSKVILDVSMSLDGFMTGPNVRDAEPMGDGGEDLHAWMAGTGPGGDVDTGLKREMDRAYGATIIGRRTFDLGLKPWGGTPWPNTPSFVVTHRVRQDLVGDNGGTFAFGNLTESVRRATAAAGDRDVAVLGADISRQLLSAGLIDEIFLHIAPLLLGGGARLFEGVEAALVPVGQPIAGSVPHLRLRVAKPADRVPSTGS